MRGHSDLKALGGAWSQTHPNTAWWLRGDRPLDLLRVVGFFAAFAAVDLATRMLSRVPWSALTSEFLLVAAVRARPGLFLVTAIATGSVMAWRGKRVWARWTELEHGRVLRVMASLFVLILLWEGTLYSYNYLLGETHLADRVVLLGLGAAAIVRPVFVGPFALQSRVIASQFSFPLGTTASQNIDELLIVALIAIAGAHLMFVLTNHRGTAPVLVVLSAAVATHFLVPGMAKSSLGWLGENEISNLPLNGYAAGWLAAGDGGWATRLAGIYERMNMPILAGTLVVELGSAVAVAHYRLMRVWLLLAMAFHVALFLTIGFWFLAWIAVEACLFTIFLLPSLRTWVRENATPARALIAVVMVVGLGGLLFHPPRLAWLDSPVGYGYRIEATGSSGQIYNVAMAAFAPLTQEMALVRAQLGVTRPASGGYGAVNPEAHRALMGIDDAAELRALEKEADPEVLAMSRRLVLDFLAYANRGGTPWSVMSPPDHFWIHAPEPSYRFQEPLTNMDIYLLVSFNREPRHQHARHLMTLVVGEDGDITIIDHDAAVSDQSLLGGHS